MVLFPISFCFSIKAQDQKCALTVEQAPELRGFKLGMEFGKVKELFPGKRYWSEGEFGLRQLRFFDYELPEERRDGLDDLSLHFVDDRLTYILVRYDNSVQFKDAADFRDKVAEAMKLKGQWHGDSRIRDGFTLECQGFKIFVDRNLGMMPEVAMSINGATDIVEKRKQEAEQKKRREFKP